MFAKCDNLFVVLLILLLSLKRFECESDDGELMFQKRGRMRISNFKCNRMKNQFII